MDINTYTANIVTKFVETEEEFIFQTISPFCDSITSKSISKRELIDALVNYRALEAENERLRHRVERLEDLCNKDEDVQITFYWKNWYDELETVKVEYYSKDRTRAFVKRFDGCIIGIPVEDLIVVTDIEEKFMNNKENI